MLALNTIQLTVEKCGFFGYSDPPLSRSAYNFTVSPSHSNVQNHGLDLTKPWILLYSVQSLSCVWLIVTPWTAASQASLSIISSWCLLKLMSIELVMPYNHLIPCGPLLLMPSVFPSIRVFFNCSTTYNIEAFIGKKKNPPLRGHMQYKTVVNQWSTVFSIHWKFIRWGVLVYYDTYCKYILIIICLKI